MTAFPQRSTLVLHFLATNWAVILDAIAKLAGIVLVVGLWVAYRQYKITIQLAKVNTQREALRLAADQCSRFGHEIVSKGGELFQTLAKTKCEFLQRCNVEVSEGKISLDAAKIKDEDVKKVMQHFPQIVIALNAYESFAIYFASRVADDNIGYIECGRSFVDFFEKAYPLYCLDRRIENYYKATQHLYFRWKARLSQEALVQNHEQLTKQISVTKEKIDPSKLQPVKPYGC